jgi:ketosteroid isomerase-like protein
VSVTETGDATPGWAASDHPEDVVLAYHRAIDAGHATEGIGLFTEDALFQARGSELTGRDAILGFLTEREAQRDRHTVHVVANAVARRRAADEAEVAALILLHVRQPDGGYALERVLDTVHVLRRNRGGWQICKRYSSPLHP